MAGITYFVALPTAASLLGNPLNAETPQRAQGLWKVFGHTGAVAFSRTGDPATGNFSDAIVLRTFGDVPDDLSAL